MSKGSKKSTHPSGLIGTNIKPIQFGGYDNHRWVGNFIIGSSRSSSVSLLQHSNKLTRPKTQPNSGKISTKSNEILLDLVSFPPFLWFLANPLRDLAGSNKISTKSSKISPDLHHFPSKSSSLPPLLISTKTYMTHGTTNSIQLVEVIGRRWVFCSTTLQNLVEFELSPNLTRGQS